MIYWAWDRQRSMREQREARLGPPTLLELLCTHAGVTLDRVRHHLEENRAFSVHIINNTEGDRMDRHILFQRLVGQDTL